MRLHRFLGNFDFSKKLLKIADGDLINQIKNVFRLNVGDEIILTDGREDDALCKISALAKDLLEVEVAGVRKIEKEPPVNAVLYCSVLKKENFELVAQKATEIGVKEIVPIITKHTVKLSLKEDRLQKIIKEAVEQSGRGVMPELKKPIPFREAVKDAQSNDVNLFCDEGGMPIGNAAKCQKRIGVFIGPEGGWDESELEFINNLPKESNFKIINLGLLTLRSETAAIIASYLALI